MAAKSGLGRGFESLIPKDFDDSILLDDKDKIRRLPIEKLQPNKEQPRQEFDQTALDDLAKSIKQHGILQPLVVTPVGDNFQIIAGERRWRAAKLAKLTSVPAIVRTFEELEKLEVALVENVQRVDLSALEQAVSIERLRQQFNLTYEQIGKRLGKNLSTVSNIARLLQLPAKARQALADKQITEGHARAILSLAKYPDRQQELLDAIVRNGWSVRQAERFATSVKSGVLDKTDRHSRVELESPETKALGKHLNTKVHVRRTAKGGRLEISFTSDDDLKRLIELLKK